MNKFFIPVIAGILILGSVGLSSDIFADKDTKNDNNPFQELWNAITSIWNAIDALQTQIDDIEPSSALSCENQNAIVAQISEFVVDEQCLPQDYDSDGFTEDIDCDDSDPSVNPDADEVPENNIDDDCDGLIDELGSQQTFAGVANDGNSNQLIPSVWSYSGFIGIQAGDAMCQAIGADHVCSYDEIELAKDKGELDTLYDDLDTGSGGVKSIWVNRLTSVIYDGNLLSPGAGARCNDWTDPGSPNGDGEFATIDADGNIAYTFDSNACYGSGCYSGDISLQCGGKQRSVLCCMATP